MYLSKLALDVRSRHFRRDYANVHDMHRTVMSAFLDLPDTTTAARQHHGVLWRLDTTTSGFTLYVQSRTQPNWKNLPQGHLTATPETRTLQPLLDAITPGRKLAFRLVANPTKCDSKTRKRLALREPDQQIQWLVRKGEQHGFVIPTTLTGQPDIAPSLTPALTGTKPTTGTITIVPTRYDGHLIITNPHHFTTTLQTGIGRAKAYGCGLISLAPARTH
ncbi:type I-E CRISPR-associated protein Cas6/Cse3/CasE [Amycolatopsis magusensis]|uniref:type I-E CRISPR-associated protein Cas6/Cse3/CasE n=1 Tax=Amycolatopsis magusensis TaxID=882444 RepID=UPI0024A9BF96|nr:type I-E CRISPR-associated protein Cas6/Cse3/CasE [Amycolatopsis magusensis]MDI5982165.1 type I-E CRISPR-associated protein Cas6/Cse3/CasE [Amycolatopsis magusensis]